MQRKQPTYGPPIPYSTHTSFNAPAGYGVDGFNAPPGHAPNTQASNPPPGYDAPEATLQQPSPSAPTDEPPPPPYETAVPNDQHVNKRHAEETAHLEKLKQEDLARSQAQYAESLSAASYGHPGSAAQYGQVVSEQYAPTQSTARYRRAPQQQTMESNDDCCPSDCDCCFCCIPSNNYRSNAYYSNNTTCCCVVQTNPSCSDCGCSDCICSDCYSGCHSSSSDDCEGFCYVIAAAVVIGTTIGGAYYTIKNLNASFSESIFEGTARTITAAAFGIGFGLALTALLPPVGAGIALGLAIWAGTMGAAIGTRATQGLTCRSTLFGDSRPRAHPEHIQSRENDLAYRPV